jgi:transglutaminase-like putative cysteine protease
MRIELYQGNSYRDYVLKETPLFRGPVLTEYTRNKTWRQAGEIHLPVNPPKPPRDADGLVRQVIRMRPSNTNSVFCVAPVVGVPEAADKQLHYNPHTEQLTRSQLGRDQTIEVYTSGFVGGRQLLFIPNNISAHNLAPLTALPSGELPRLINLAQVLVAHLAPDQGLERVRALTNHLHDSGLYQYSLTTPRRNPTIDPVEDFLFEHQSGHCEYFASALALMLRAIDIPARVVLGFNGGEYNVMGGFYQVRQLHAHAWVEAYLPRDQLPPQLRRDSAWKHGGWITLDPTPGSSGAISRIGATAGVPTFRQVADYARYLWSSYIMGLDSDRQLRTIYEPVALWLVRSGKKLLDPAAWRFLVHLLVRALGIDTPWVAPLAGTIALAALLAAGLLGLQHARFSRLANLLAPFRFGRVKSSAPTATVDFYRRLELILARFGILGGSSLTQYEFAVLARGQLIDRGLSAVASAPLAVAEAFYRVRFGCRQLDKREVEAVEQALTNLNEAAERVSAPAHG